MAIVITPAMAQEILDSSNTGNRRVRMWWVIALSSSIARGDWLLTHQGIAFDENGRLIDGQHRLRAIVLSGTSVKMFVFQGLDPRGFMAIDVGVKRSTSDTTGLDKGAAEVCRKLAALAGKTGATCTTAQQVLEVAEIGVKEIHERLMEYCGTSKKVYSSAHVRAAAVLLVMDGYPEDQVFKMYRDALLQRYEILPPVGLAFIRQVTDGKCSAVAGGHDLLARALKFLNPGNSSLTKIQIGEADAASAAAYGRAIVRRALASQAVTS